MSDDETEFPDSTYSSGNTDEFIQNLEDELDDSDNSSSDEEAESQDSRIKRLKSDSTSETEASTSLGTSEQKLDGCTHPGSFGGICIHCGQKVDGESGVSFGYIHKMSDDETEFPDGTDSSGSTDEIIQNLEDELDDDGSDNSSSDEEAESQDSRIKRLKSDSTSETKASTSAGTAEQKLDGCMHPGSFGGIYIHCGQKVDGESGVSFGYIHKVSEHPKKMKKKGGKAKDGEKPQRLTNRKRISSVYWIFIISTVFLCCDGGEAYYYDYFKLAEQWAPGVCNHNGNCHPHVNKERFTIHGLWVQNSTEPSSKPKPKPDGIVPLCPKFSKQLSLRMRRDWPSLYEKTSEELWRHEWEQHGYFSDMNCEDYCRKGLFFHQNCDVKKALEESSIHPSNNPINTSFS